MDDSVLEEYGYLLLGGGGGGPQHFSVSPSPLWTNTVLEVIGTWLGLGLGFFWTKGLKTGLDNSTPLIMISDESLHWLRVPMPTI